MHQKQKPMFNIIEPAIVRAQFTSNRDASFSSYIHPHKNQHQHQRQQQTTEEADQLSIFDAAEYFKGLHDEQKEQAASPRVIDLSVARLSSSSTEPSNYRARSFHATPTASSEASWSSHTGLLQQPNLMRGSLVKNHSPNTNTATPTTRWGRISHFGRKCPCSGKKSVQVEDRTSSKTPRMVDLGRSSSSNGTSYPPSIYSIRQNSPKITPSSGNPSLNLVSKKLDSSSSSSTTSTTITAKNPIGFSCSNGNNPNGFLAFNSINAKVVGPIPPTTTNTTTTTKTTTTGGLSTNGFTFPVLENPPAGVKKMFNVIAPGLDPHRDSLEVYQPRSPKSRRASYEDETTLSDGSSDLFELESFSTPNFNASIKRFGAQAWRRSLEEEPCNGGDDVESMAPTEGYAPTEYSVDWSVTTAEGFDRSSLANFSVSASEVGYAAMRRETDNRREDNGTENNTNNNKRNKGSTISSGNNGGGLLMSCRCEKAVSVGPGPVKSIGQGEGHNPRNTGRHTRAKEEGPGHGMELNGARTGNNYCNKLGGVGGVVGRSRSNILPKPFAT